MSSQTSKRTAFFDFEWSQHLAACPKLLGSSAAVVAIGCSQPLSEALSVVWRCRCQDIHRVFFWWHNWTSKIRRSHWLRGSTVPPNHGDLSLQEIVPIFCWEDVSILGSPKWPKRLGVECVGNLKAVQRDLILSHSHIHYLTVLRLEEWFGAGRRFCLLHNMCNYM